VGGDNRAKFTGISPRVHHDRLAADRIADDVTVAGKRPNDSMSEDFK
jgi:hypothetical protein